MSKAEKTRCIVCDTVGEWKNVDHLQVAKTGLSICQHCGFVTHIDQLKTKDEIKEYYKKDYRPAPNSGNFFTGQRKLHYHQAFLSDLYTEWGKKDKKPEIFESGTAYGLFLKWSKDYLKAKGTEASVTGTEWTESFKRVCFHHHGITLTDEMEENKLFDLIASYKVLEHQVDADREMRKFAKALKPDGLAYIGVPIWFGEMHNFGMGGFDLGYYYHKDHINVWNETLFKTLLKKAGFEIIKENDIYYDHVFLCKRNDELMKEKPIFRDPKKVEKEMINIQIAENFKLENKFKDAIETWSNFPIAWINNYEKNRKQLNELGFEGIYEQHCKLAIEACPKSAEIMGHVAEICARYDEHERAIEHFDKAIAMRPNSPSYLLARAQSFIALSQLVDKDEEKLTCLAEARGTLYHCAGISDQTRYQTLDYIYKVESMMPVVASVEVK